MLVPVPVFVCCIYGQLFPLDALSLRQWIEAGSFNVKMPLELNACI